MNSIFCKMCFKIILLISFLSSLAYSNSIKPGPGELLRDEKSYQPEMVEQLIKDGADINVLYDGKSLLYWAIKNDKRRSFYFLLENGFDLRSDKDLNTSLTHFLVRKSLFSVIWNKEEIKALFDHGADINALDKKGYSPLISMVERYRGIDIDEIEFLLKLGVNTNFKDQKGESALYKAAYLKSSDLVSLLLKYGADIKSETISKKKILHIAAEKNLTNLLSYCLEKGEDPNSKDKYGYTPLIYASGNHSLEAAKILIDAGADPKIKTKNGLNPLINCLRSASKRKYRMAKMLLDNGAEKSFLTNVQITSIHLDLKSELNQALLKSTLMGKADDVRKLIDEGAYVNYVSYRKESGLINSLINDDKDVFKTLLKRGADPNRSFFGTPLISIICSEVERNLPQIKESIYYYLVTDTNGYKSRWTVEDLNLLINKGVNINQKDNKGLTPVMYAASGTNNLSFQKVKLLVDKGADLKIKDNKGETALFYATANKEIFKFLLANGADLNVLNKAGLSPMDKVLSEGRKSILKYLAQKNLISKKYLNITSTKEETSTPVFVQQSGHTGSRLSCIDISGNGEFVLTGAADKQIKLWDMKTGKLIRTLRGHNQELTSVKFLKDNKTAISCSKGPFIFKWDLETGHIIEKIKGHRSSITSLTLSSDRKSALTTSPDNSIRLWDLEKGIEIKRIIKKGMGYLPQTILSPDGKSFLFLDHRKVELYDINTEKIKMRFKGNNKAAAFSHDGSLIATIDPVSKRDIIIWNSKTGEIETILFRGEYNPINCLSFSNDDKYIVSGSSSDNILMIWNIKKSKLIAQRKMLNSIKAVCFSHDNSYILSSEGSSLFTSDFKSILAFYNKKGSRKDSKTAITELLKPVNKFSSYMFPIQSINISNNDSNVLTINNVLNHSIQIWDLKNGKLKSTVPGHKLWIYDAVFSPDGSKIAVATFTRNKENKDNKLLEIRDIKTGDVLKSIIGNKGAFGRVIFSPDQKTVYLTGTGRDSKIECYDLEKGILIKTIKAHPDGFINSIDISADGKYLLSGAGYWRSGVSDSDTRAQGEMKLWDLNSGNLLKTYIEQEEPVTDVAFSRDGKLVAASTGYIHRGTPGEILVFDTISGKEIAKFNEHKRYINSISFSPDGKSLLSAGGDNKIIIRDLKSKQIELVKEADKLPVKEAVFTNDGNYVLYGGDNGILSLLNISNKAYINFSSFEKEWVIYNDKYFDSSPRGGNQIAMVKGMKAFAIDQLAVSANRPDLLLKPLGISEPAYIEHLYTAHLKRLSRLKFNKQIKALSTEIPKIGDLKSNKKGDNLYLSFNVQDKIALKSYNIFVNDVPKYRREGKKISGKIRKIKDSIILSSGNNKIEITSFNSSSNESLREMINIENKKSVNGNLYFMGFGVSRYSNRKLNLKYAVKDVKDLATMFKKMEGKYFHKVFTKTFLDKEVTLSNLHTARNFLRKSNVDDTFVLFIAGHGYYDLSKKATYYYLTYNTDLNNLSKTAADFEMLENILYEIAPRKKLFLIDTCESGELDPDLKEEFFAKAQNHGMTARTFRGIKSKKKFKDYGPRAFLKQKDRYIYNDLVRRAGAVVFSSSQGNELSYESDSIKNGFFTNSIINAFEQKESDTDSNGLISLKELKRFVTNDVKIRTFDNQHPTVDRDNKYIDMFFPVVK